MSSVEYLYRLHALIAQGYQTFTRLEYDLGEGLEPELSELSLPESLVSAITLADERPSSYETLNLAYALKLSEQDYSTQVINSDVDKTISGTQELISRQTAAASVVAKLRMGLLIAETAIELAPTVSEWLEAEKDETGGESPIVVDLENLGD